MSLTRKLLKGMGLTDEQVDTIIEAHTDTVDGLKADISKYKGDAEKLPTVQKELDDLKAAGDGGWEEKAKDFERLGYLNDLLRNSMMRSKYDDDSGSVFFYLWYYRDLAKTSYLYLHEESLNEDELVLIWQPQNEDEPYTEDMYLMGKSYYEENIK